MKVRYTQGVGLGMKATEERALLEAIPALIGKVENYDTAPILEAVKQALEEPPKKTLDVSPVLSIVRSAS